MREIKFRYRFKNKITGVVRTSYLDIDQVERASFGQGWPDGWPDWDICSRDLWTGLHDKNGLTEIYEGDIVLIPDEYKDRILDDGSGPIEPYNHLSQIIFKDGSFGVEIKERGELWGVGFLSFERLYGEMEQDEIEVIGNIYENPELVAGD